MKLLAGILALALWATSAVADANAKANELFVEAVQLWKQAEAVEGWGQQDVEARLTLIEQVDAKLDSIVSDYPSSNLAVQLMVGDVGPVSIDKVAEAVAELSAEVEADILCNQKPKHCILTRALERAGSDAMELKAIVRAQAASGDVTGAIETLEKLENAAIAGVLSIDIVLIQAAIGDTAGALETAERLNPKVYDKKVLIKEIGMISDIVSGDKQALKAVEPYTRHIAQRYIPAALAATGNVAEALEMATQIKEKFELFEVIRSIAFTQAASGDLAGTLEAVERITDDYRQISTQDLQLISL